MFSILTVLGGLIAGAIAAISGFGIGSLLTPLLSYQFGTKLAVAAVSIPHFAGTIVRFWLLRKHIDRKILLSFGLTSAAGGLFGALLQSRFESPVLSVILAALLVFAGGMGLLGLSRKIEFRGAGAWVAGALSGLFGGLVGNQGGIRSGAMLGLNVRREAFVATATAIALIVDAARMPVYLISEASDLNAALPLIGLATAGVLVGTFGGARILRRIPDKIFQRIVASLILALGIWMFFHS
ncbi:MAG TPA: sulfite exporter TauE/SafE family protein [Bacteroidota bacterium]|jgi:uncharacterized membrane protein YfcA|nr:sulfite exporter TauE/SafE family protein [Bacteroidota bacterium]